MPASEYCQAVGGLSAGSTRCDVIGLSVAAKGSNPVASVTNAASSVAGMFKDWP